MHGTHPHPPRTTNRDPSRPSGEGTTGAAATANGAPDGTEAYEAPRDAVADETDARTMTHRTDPGFEDAHSDATGATATRGAGVIPT